MGSSLLDAVEPPAVFNGATAVGFHDLFDGIQDALFKSAWAAAFRAVVHGVRDA